MDPRTVSLIQVSFARLEPQLDEFAQVFYAYLFEHNPRIEYMFRGDQKDQEVKLAHMIGVVARSLDRPAEIEPILRRLGERHVEYGVREADYIVFGEALMWTLDRFLGNGGRDTRMAWQELYRFISDTMQGRGSR